MSKKTSKKMGRPPKYETVAQMQIIIDRYFDECFYKRFGSNIVNFELPEDYQFITDDVHPTVTGLALALNMTRKGLIDYEKKDEFGNTIKKAKTRIEADLEQRLFGPSVAGVIFNLRHNYGWKA